METRVIDKAEATTNSCCCTYGYYAGPVEPPEAPEEPEEPEEPEAPEEPEEPAPAEDE